MLVSQSSSLMRLRSLRAIADRAEGTIARLRYALGGDRPSQTARLTRSLAPLQGRQVRSPTSPGWYFTDGSTEANAPASKPPTYATQFFPNATLKLQ